MFFQTKHGLNGLSYSYDFSFFQPNPETDGKFFSDASCSLSLCSAMGKKKKSPGTLWNVEFDMVSEHCLPLKFDRHLYSKEVQNTGLCIYKSGHGWQTSSVVLYSQPSVNTI